jgi:flagellar biosynthesis regulator FlaF
MNNNQIKEQIESLGFTRSIGTTFYKFKRYSEYWLAIELNGSITFESYYRNQCSDKSTAKYSIRFDDIYEFNSFADELLKFNKKEVTA